MAYFIFESCGSESKIGYFGWFKSRSIETYGLCYHSVHFYIFIFFLKYKFSFKSAWIVFQMASRQAGNITWEKLVGHSHLIIEYQLAFDVNFSNGLLHHFLFIIIDFTCVCVLLFMYWNYLRKTICFACRNLWYRYGEPTIWIQWSFQIESRFAYGHYAKGNFLFEI